MTAHSPRPPYIGLPDPITGSGKWQPPTPDDNPQPSAFYVLVHLRMKNGSIRHKAVRTVTPEDYIRRMGRSSTVKAYRWSAATELETLMYGRWFLELQSTWSGRPVPATWFCPSCKSRADATLTDELTA